MYRNFVIISNGVFILIDLSYFAYFERLMPCFTRLGIILYNVDLGLKNRTIFLTDENIVRFILFLFNDGVVFMYIYKRYRYLDIYLVSFSSFAFPL